MRLLKTLSKTKKTAEKKLQSFGKTLGASVTKVNNATNPASAYSKMKRATAAKTPAKRTKGAYKY